MTVPKEHPLCDNCPRILRDEAEFLVMPTWYIRLFCCRDKEPRVYFTRPESLTSWGDE